MTPIDLIPTPDILPVHWVWLKFFQLVTLVPHFLLMNIMLGSTLIAFAGSMRGSGNGDYLQRDIADRLPFIIAFTINAGVAPLLFLQVLYGHLVYVSSMLMAVYWMAVIGILIPGYYCAYGVKYKYDAGKTFRMVLLGLTAVILLTVAFIFVNNMTLMQRPDAWGSYFKNASGTLLNLDDPVLLPRYLHIVTASVAVAGLFMALVGRRRSKGPDLQVGKMIDTGLAWFTAGTAVQFGLGIWFLLALKNEVRQLFIGGSIPHTLLLAGGIVGALVGLVAGVKKRVGVALAAVLVTVVVMVLVRDEVRTAYLAPFFDVTSVPVRPEYTPMVIFIVTLVAGIGIIAYMLRMAFLGRSSPPPPEVG